MSEMKTVSPRSEMLFAALRISIGWVFFWAFLDKTFGLGFYWYQEEQFGTDPTEAWIQGGEPTAGFLIYGTAGKWFESFFSSLAGNPLVDTLFMLGLLGVGLTMMLGVGRKIGALSGITMMLMMWMASLPLDNNPLIDDHIVYAIVLLILGFTPFYGRTYSLRDKFDDLISQYPVLE